MFVATESYADVMPTVTEDSSDGTQSVEGAPVEEMPTVTEDDTETEDSIEVLALEPGAPVVTRRRLESQPAAVTPVESVAAETVQPEQAVPAANRFPRGNPVRDSGSVQVSHPRQVVRVFKANASSDTVKVRNPKDQNDDTDSDDDNFVCEIDEMGTKVCPPHKTEVLEEQISSTKPGMERRSAVIRSLQQMRVRVYVIEGKSIRNTKEILDHIRRVVGFVARENRIHEKTGPLGDQRCLLYQDTEGRLFNLTLPKHAVGPASRWEEYLDSFSGKEAMIALTVLCRSFPCATEGMYHCQRLHYIPVGFVQF